MRKSLRCFSIVGILFIIFSVLWSEPQHNISALIIPIEIWVQNTCFFELIASIEYFKNIFSNEFIISININRNGIFGTILMWSCIYIFESSFSIFIFNICVGRRINVVKLKIFTICFVAVISWGIVDDDSKVVGVILLENWVEIVLYSKFGVIVVTWND